MVVQASTIDTWKTRDNNAMHAKSGLRVFLKWKIYRPDSVIAAVITLKTMRISLTRMLIGIATFCVSLSACSYLEFEWWLNLAVGLIWGFVALIVERRHAPKVCWLIVYCAIGFFTIYAFLPMNFRTGDTLLAAIYGCIVGTALALFFDFASS